MNFRRQAMQAKIYGWVAGLLSLMINQCLGFLVIRQIIRTRYPDKPYGTEAYESFGYAMLAWQEFLIAMSFWFLISMVIAISFGGFIEERVLYRYRINNYK